ncbi:glucose-1-phosphate adenylyltransferase subunit GlgD [Oscillospiraceae bacterium MB08-C2-2]|nr:glucose-1-phosphate adenylyltransferase subunit GlgD [Oscillospiraceae bacterium MB08-C2-2]
MRNRNILGIVFSNMHDDTVRSLTTHRSMASIPVGGRYRLIDFALSNLVNAGIEDVGVITKSNYQSLMDHLGSGREWDLARKRGGLSILPPFGSAGSGIYRGKVEALANIETYIRFHDPEYLLLTDCDMLANIDLGPFIDAHMERGVELSVLYARANLWPEHAQDTTVLEVNDRSMVTGVQLHPHARGQQNIFMNVCLVSRRYLERRVFESFSRSCFNFDEAILQAGVEETAIYAHPYSGFFFRIGCMKSYYDANLSLLEPEVRHALFPMSQPIYTKVRDDPPTLYGLDAQVSNSLIADGCRIEGIVENSILFRGVQVAKGAKIRNSIVMQNTCAGEYSSLDCVITDKDVIIQEGRVMRGFETYPVFIEKGATV